MAKKRNAFDDFLDSVGGNIHRIRMRKGHTLEQLGRSVGLDKSNMHRIEQGKNITLVTLLKISAILEVKPTDLIKSDVSVTTADAEAFVRRKKRK
jgi:DNA-binding Xre family transcriptional regulator